MAQVYQAIYFLTRLVLRQFWVKEPRHRKTNIGNKCATSIVERVVCTKHLCAISASMLSVP